MFIVKSLNKKLVVSVSKKTKKYEGKGRVGEWERGRLRDLEAKGFCHFFQAAFRAHICFITREIAIFTDICSRGLTW